MRLNFQIVRSVLFACVLLLVINLVSSPLQASPAEGMVVSDQTLDGMPRGVVWAQLSGATGFGKNIEAMSSTLKYQKVQWDKMDITDFCKYGLSDYETLKPSIEKLFLAEPNISKARDILKSIKNKKLFNEQMIPKIKNKRLVIENGDVIPSGETLKGWTIPCEKKFNNNDYWQFLFHVGRGGEIKNFDFFVLIDDKNFAKRGLPLKPSYLNRRESLSSAIKSLVRENHLSIDGLADLLRSKDFLVEKLDPKIKGEIEYLITGKNTRYWHRVLPVPGGNFGVFNALVLADRKGKMYQLDKYGRNKIWLK
jgi:hypothetical protein